MLRTAMLTSDVQATYMGLLRVGRKPADACSVACYHSRMIRAQLLYLWSNLLRC